MENTKENLMPSNSRENQSQDSATLLISNLNSAPNSPRTKQLTSSIPSSTQIHAHEAEKLGIELFEGDGFRKFLDESLFSDVTLIVNNSRNESKRYACHRIILSASEYLEKELEKLGDSKELVLSDLPFGDQFEIVLNYLYEGRTELTLENGPVLLALAKFFLLNELKEATVEFLILIIHK